MLTALVHTKLGRGFHEFLRSKRGRTLDKFLVKHFRYSLLMTVHTRLVGFEPLPVLMLYTIGRKSGLERSTVMPYFPWNGVLHLIPGNGGKNQDPHWVENLKA